MKHRIFALSTALFIFLVGCSAATQPDSTGVSSPLSLDDIPSYSSDPYIPVNGNAPDFSDADLSTDAFEYYSDLDQLGRCGTAYANICIDTMPTEKRSNIGSIRPSGWQTVKYNGLVDGNYLYNRCHLIGYQLSAENANERNLITGTRYLNVDGMLPFENLVADYVKETENHVLYRVTPVFDGNNLVASGVQMEAMSVEDRGEGVFFNVYCYNNQPGISIDYATGVSHLSDDEATTSTEQGYILNTSAMKFHKPSCPSVSQIKDANRKSYTGTRGELLSQGYDPCGSCNP